MRRILSTFAVLCLSIGLALGPMGSYAYAGCFADGVNGALDEAEPGKFHFRGRTYDFDEFVDAFQTFDEIGEADNVSFIAATKGKKGVRTGHRYFDSEVVILKELNDTVLDSKVTVDALLNLHKTALVEAIKRRPALSNKIVEKYSDFKSVRFQYDAVDEATEVLLEEALVEANEVLALAVRQFEETRIPVEKARGIANDPLNWVLAGSGELFDFASNANRMGRSEFGSIAFQAGSRPRIRPYESYRQQISERVIEIERLRNRVATHLQRFPSMYETLGIQVGEGLANPFGLSRDLIDVIRKTKPGTARSKVAFIDQLRTRVHRRFKYLFTEAQMEDIHRYFTLVDQFSAPLLVGKREVINLDDAKFGIISADFAGQGARNHIETQKALYRAIALNPTPYRKKSSEMADIAIVNSRVGEERATEALDRAKDQFRRDVLDNLDLTIDELGQDAVRFTGDDGYFFPPRPLTLPEKHSLMAQIARNSPGQPSDYRMTFLPDNYESVSRARIPRKDRSKLIVTAEQYEKAIRDFLTKTEDPAKLRNLVIGIDIQPSTSERGTFTVMMSGTYDAGQIPELRQTLQSLIPDGFELGGPRITTYQKAAWLDMNLIDAQSTSKPQILVPLRACWAPTEPNHRLVLGRLLSP